MRKATKTSKHCPGSVRIRSTLTRATAPRVLPQDKTRTVQEYRRRDYFYRYLTKISTGVAVNRNGNSSSYWQHIYRGLDNIVRVGCADADFPFLFAGALNELEFVRAFLYIVYKDNSSHGIYYKAAESGKLVYTHSMAVKVARWWALPDNIKYRGYRVDLWFLGM